jgi:hypothetical protein
MDHLLIPDPHAHPDYSNKRFEWLGKLIVDLKPDKVICIGDFADMPSLCTYDKGTSGFEGRRYKDDVECVKDAQRRMFDPIRKSKKRMPKFLMHEGNHEHRIKRAISSDAAQLEGIISLNDLAYDRYGWQVIEYQGSTPGINIVDGIAYAHYFTSGVMSRPISGLHPAYALLTKQFMSCSQGHVHTTDYCVRTDARGKMIHGMICGWFGDYFADYAGDANNMWWSGVIHKKNVEDGDYEPRWISLNSMRKEYG